MATEKITATDPRITGFLTAWHAAQRADFERNYDRLVYDDYAMKTAHERRRFIACDRGNEHTRSGVYLVDRTTGDVYSIKAYGVPNRRLGTLEEVTARFAQAVQS
jgi:hypothetical protein